MSNQKHNIDEGYIKFNIEWINEPLCVDVPKELMLWRDKMHELKQIGHYTEINIGYGNISVKLDNGFLISGTQTGNIFPIQPNHFTLVSDYNIAQNSVVCIGPIKASSESMTHAAIYEAHPSIKAIIHIHNLDLWKTLMKKVPTTNKDVPYGTPEMANEVFRLFKETNVDKEKIIIMAGHDEGIIAFGKNLDEAGAVLLNFLTKFN